MIILWTAPQSACFVHLDGLCAIYHKLKLQSLCYFVLDLYIKPFHSYRKGEWGNIKVFANGKNICIADRSERSRVGRLRV